MVEPKERVDYYCNGESRYLNVTSWLFIQIPVVVTPRRRRGDARRAYVYPYFKSAPAKPVHSSNNCLTSSKIGQPLRTLQTFLENTTLTGPDVSSKVFSLGVQLFSSTLKLYVCNSWIRYTLTASNANLYPTYKR